MTLMLKRISSRLKGSAATMRPAVLISFWMLLVFWCPMCMGNNSFLRSTTRNRNNYRDDEMHNQWVHKFGLRDARVTSEAFSSAKASGGGDAAKGSPFGLGLGKTLYEANKNNAFATTELRTEDTEQGGKIFGAPSGMLKLISMARLILCPLNNRICTQLTCSTSVPYSYSCAIAKYPLVYINNLSHLTQDCP